MEEHTPSRKIKISSQEQVIFHQRRTGFEKPNDEIDPFSQQKPLMIIYYLNTSAVLHFTGCII
jgi:hypothetical protein